MSQIFKSGTGGGGGGVTSVTGTHGVTASPTTGAVVVSGVNATTSTVGVASFNPTEFTVSGAGEVSLITPAPPIASAIQNLGIGYSTGTFTVFSANGTSLSVANPAFITLQSTTPGEMVTITVTANETFTDGSTGTIAGMKFGLPYGGTDVSWATNMPLFLYAVLKSDASTIAFMVSRNPSAKTAPVAAGIGQGGAIVNVGQEDFFSLRTITTSDYASQPCLYLGCFQAQYTAGSPSFYTVQTLVLGTDGIGLDFNDRKFNMPAGVNGAATGAYFFANGGTAPVWTTQGYTYNVKTDGYVEIGFNASPLSVSGAGNVLLQFVIPYSTDGQDNPSLGSAALESNTSIFTLMTGFENANEIFFNLFQSGSALATNAAFVNTLANDIDINFLYMAYIRQ